jgi:hypothetical protein
LGQSQSAVGQSSAQIETGNQNRKSKLKSNSPQITKRGMI